MGSDITPRCVAAATAAHRPYHEHSKENLKSILRGEVKCALVQT